MEQLTYGETSIITKKNHIKQFLTWNHLNFDKLEAFFSFQTLKLVKMFRKLRKLYFSEAVPLVAPQNWCSTNMATYLK